MRLLLIRSAYIVAVAEFTFVLWFLLPQFTAFIIYERETQMFEMMRINGVPTWLYFVSAYTFDYLLYFGWCAVFLLVAGIFGSQVVTSSGFFPWLAMCIVTGQACIGISYFLAAVFKRERVASIFAFLFLGTIGGVAYIVAQLPELLPTSALLVPPLASMQAMNL
jgi:hypothetical protein